MNLSGLRNGKREVGSDKGGKGDLKNIKFSVTYRLKVPQEHRQLQSVMRFKQTQ